ncbi:hypothetical protein IAU59_005409 [Kwoniella sp. CBS 9459]
MIAVPPQFVSYKLDHAQPFSYHVPTSGWGTLEDPNIIQSAIEYSLIFVVDREKSKVLLGLKRRGMGVNLFNGFGGKREKSETMLQCAARELEEEAGIIPIPGGLMYKGVLYSARPRPDQSPSEDMMVMIKIHFFACVAWSGIPQTSEEMIPKWFDIRSSDQSERMNKEYPALPVTQMWPEASFYLEPVLKSILNGHDEEVFLGRINYEMLSKREAPTTLPALDGLTIQTASHPHSGSEQDEKAERLGGWWMCLTPRASIPVTQNGDIV